MIDKGEHFILHNPVWRALLNWLLGQCETCRIWWWEGCVFRMTERKRFRFFCTSVPLGAVWWKLLSANGSPSRIQDIQSLQENMNKDHVMIKKKLVNSYTPIQLQRGRRSSNLHPNSTTSGPYRSKHTLSFWNMNSDTHSLSAAPVGAHCSRTVLNNPLRGWEGGRHRHIWKGALWARPGLQCPHSKPGNVRKKIWVSTGWK